MGISSYDLEREVLEIKRLRPGDEYRLHSFFVDLTTSGGDETFHPHPFTRKAAEKICNKPEQKNNLDMYFAIFLGNDIAGYGFLRGFEEGFEVPSLGIAVHPDVQGKGLSKLLMLFMHRAAKLRGCKEIFLKVYKDNTRAVTVYKDLGYDLKEINDKELAGKVTL